MRWLVLVVGILGAAGVTVGAFAAHGLEDLLVKQGLEPDEVTKRAGQCEVAVRYHMMHVLALLALACDGSNIPANRKLFASMFFVGGIALFGGGLYSMVFLGVMGHWAIVPAGGFCFIVGWLALASAAFTRQTP